MAKSTLTLSSGFYTLELHGPIHVTKNGQYVGCIEFRGGFGPITYRMVQSAIDNAIEYFNPLDNIEDRIAINKAIRELMKPESTKLTNSQIGLIYSALCCAACLSREKGHNADANEFHTLMELVDELRMSDFNFELKPVN
jgi:hypothetical protein